MVYRYSIEVVEVKDDRLVRCKVRYLCESLAETEEKIEMLSSHTIFHART